MQRVDHLLVVTGANCGHDQPLCLEAGEQGRALGAWQQAGFGHDGTNLISRAAVNAAAVLDDIAAQNAGFELLQG